MKRHSNLSIIQIILLSLYFSVSHAQQKCIDLGVGIGVGNEEIALIDFFKNGSAWEPYNSDNLRYYQVLNQESFKVVNGAYWHYDVDWNGQPDSWNSEYDQRADCYINFWDMMVDQNKIRPDGYPNTVPLTIYKYTPSNIDPNQSPNTSQPVVITHVSRRIYFPKNLPHDGWVLKWEGTGTIQFQGIDVTSANVPYQNNGNSWTPDGSFAGDDYQFQSTGSGRAVCGLYWMVHGWVLNIVSSSTSDPIRNITFTYPGLEDEYDAGQRFNPLFLERMRQFKCLRYMGYLNSNGIQGRTLVGENNPYHDTEMLKWLRWNERTTENWYQLNNGNGGNYEYIIELSNLTGTDPWVNIPYCANEVYADSLVKLFMEKLNPDLTLYLEVGNEMWNFGAGFDGFFWQAASRVRFYPGLGDVEARGAYINRIFGRVTDVAGARNLPRIKRVYGAFPRYYDVNNRTVQMIEPDHWDALATTWYFDLSYENETGNTCRDPNTGQSWRQLLYNWHLAHPTDQAGFNQLYSQYLTNEFRCEGSYSNNVDMVLAKYYNKEVYCYEGGNHTFYGCTNSPNRTQLNGELDFETPSFPDYITDNSFINAVCAADESNEVGNVYREVIDSLQSAGVRLANHLSFSGGSSCYGVWSFIQPRDITQPLSYLLSHYGKFQAFSERIATDNCGQLEIVLEQDTVGPGLSILLDGINDYVDGQATYIPNETSDYTMETWFNPLYIDRDQVIISFSNDGVNNNYNLIKLRADGKITWEIGNNSIVLAKMVGSNLLAEKWYHVAAVKSGQRYTLYINGISVASSNYTIPVSARTNFTLGAIEHDGIASGWFAGNIDETRIWNIARTANDIREYMCKKIPYSYAQYANLRSYYRFDETDYVNLRVYDRSTRSVTGRLMNVTITSRSRYAVSGAPIGDISRYRYSTTWDGTSLSLTHPQGDMMAVTNMGQGSPEGVQLYMINGASHYNNAPLYYNGISDERTLGVYMVNGTEPNYDVTYVYSGNPDALTGSTEGDNRLLRRDGYDAEEWLHSGARLDNIANSLTVSCKENSRGEYNLANRHSLNTLRPGSGTSLINNQTPTGETDGLIRFLDLTDYTVAFWAKGWGEVFNFTGKMEENEQRFTCNPSNHVAISCQLRYSKGWSGPEYVGSNSYIADLNQWMYYTITRKGSRVTIYLNGNVIATGDLLSSFPIKEMHLMHDPAWQSGNYPGGRANISIDELAVFNTAIDQATIRDWMCKKINREHPFECKNLILYFNFDENTGNVLEDKRGPSDLVLTTNSQGFQWIPSGAAVGDESVHDYVSPNEISMSHIDGDNITATRTSGTSSGVHLYRINNMPPVPSSTDNPAILSLDSTRYWGIYSVNGYDGTSQYSITDYYQNNSQVNLANESQLRLLSRTDNAASPWSSNLLVTPNTTKHTLTLAAQARGEYVLAGISANTFNEYTAPEQPVFANGNGLFNLDTVCGNSTGLLFRVEPVVGVTSYIWTIPQGLDGYSTSDTILLNASYTGSTIQQTTISVVAVNSYGQSTAATHSLALLPPTTQSDAGPDQILIPPVTSTTMDGNAPLAFESGLWNQSQGTGIIANVNNPSSIVNSISLGVNYFNWTISNTKCPASVDSARVLVAPPPVDIVLSDGTPLPLIICQNDIITIRAIPAEDIAPNGYFWTLPSGLNMLSQNGDEATIQATSGVGGSISVAAIYNGSNSGTYTSLPVNVSLQPSKPVFEEVPDVLCLNVDALTSIQLDPTIDSVEWILPYGIYPVDYPKSTSESIKIQAIDMMTGYIKARTFNNGCTSTAAIDSFAISAGQAPDKPMLYLGTDGGTADAVCANSLALLWVQNYDANVTYEWQWETNVEQLNYFGENNSASLFHINESNSNIRVRAISTSATCNTSEWYEFYAWPQPEGPANINNIAITNPAGQNPMTIMPGLIYTFTVTGNGEYYFWDVPDNILSIADGDSYDESNNLRPIQTTAGYLDVYAITLRGCASPNTRLNIGTPGSILPPVYVSGQTSICQGTNLNITVSNVGATQYIWTLPDNTIFTTTTPVLNQAISNSQRGIMTVVARNATTTSTPLEIEIAIQPTFLNSVGFVDEEGNTLDEIEVCTDDYGKRVTHLDALASSYIWEIHGSAIEFTPRYEPGHENENNYELENRTSPIDTMMPINYVNWRCRNDGTDGGYIVVTAVNGCGGSNVSDSIYYYWAKPFNLIIPEFTESPTQLCVGSTANYEVRNIPGAENYIWHFPDGLVASDLVTSSPSITVDVTNGTGGVVTVYANGNTCGGGRTVDQISDPIAIQGEPIDFHFIDEPAAACEGDAITYSVNEIGVPIYNWSLPEGLRSIIVDDDDLVGITISGSWNEEIRPNLVNGEFKRETNNAARSITYTPSLPYSGTYRVSISYYVDWDVSSNMPVTINHANGEQNMFVNLGAPPEDGIWHSLGEFDFTQGNAGWVRISTSNLSNGVSIADAVRFEILSIPDDTTMTYTANGGQGGAVCVSVDVPQCSTPYTICSNPVNLGGTLETPVFSAQENSVCQGISYTYRVSDIGADTYTWILPSGMNINGQTGTVTGLGRIVSINMVADPGNAVQIGVQGVINSCNITSEIINTNDILFDGTSCKLTDPVFIQQPLSICNGGNALYTVTAVQYAESYEWVLPAGLRLTTGETGTVTTVTPTITVESDGTVTGGTGRIRVTALSTTIPASNPVNTTNIISINSSPVFTVAATDVTSCAQVDGSLTISGLTASTQYSVGYSYNGTAVAPTNLTTNNLGTILINNLQSGTYSPISVDLAGCSTIDNLSHIIASLQTANINTINLQNATACDTEGSVEIQLSNATEGEIYSIDFTNDGIPDDTVTVVTGSIRLSALAIGTVFNNTSLFNISSQCVSNSSFSGTIEGPSSFTINNVAYIDPLQCIDSGAIIITLSGASESNIFSVDLNNDNSIEKYGIVENGNILLNGITPGTTINNLRITDTLTNCSSSYTTSGTINEITSAPIVSIALGQPTNCNDGGTLVIVLSGAQNGDVYNLDYTGDFISDVSGTVSTNQLNLTNIPAGEVITGIHLVQATTLCESDSNYTAVVSNPSNLSITDVNVTSPLHCGEFGQMTINLQGSINGNQYSIDYTGDNISDRLITANAELLIITDLQIGTSINSVQVSHIGTGCGATINENVEIVSPPIPEVSMNAIESSCTNDSSIILSGGTPEGGIYMINNQTATELSPSLLGPGTWYVSYFYTDINSCTDSDSVSWVVNTPPVIALVGDQNPCPFATELIYSADINPNYSYNWSVTGGTYRNLTNPWEISVDFTESISASINVIAHDITTNCIDTSLFEITFADVDNPTIINCFDSIEFNAEYDPKGWHYILTDQDTAIVPLATDACSGAMVNLFFNVDDAGNNAIADLPGYRINVTQENHITWLAVDPSGNEAECQSELIFEYNPRIPSAFSPNGDGVNDIWEINYLLLFPECVVKVYNRWGMLVFESEKGYTSPWDGLNSKGKSVPVDSYFYVITLNNGSHELKGTISVVY